MRTTATLTSKGQLTLPKKIREQLGLRQGDRVELISENGQVVLRPQRADEHAFSSWIGRFSLPEGEDPVAFVRDLRDDGEYEMVVTTADCKQP